MVCFLSDSTLDAQTLRGLRALYRLDLWDHLDFLDERQLWDLSCLCHDLHPWGLHCLHHDVHLWNLYDHNNGDIDHLISVLQLGNLYGLLNHLAHVGLSLRHDRDVNGLVYELQRWNLDALGLLVDFLLDDAFSPLRPCRRRVERTCSHPVASFAASE